MVQLDPFSRAFIRRSIEMADEDLRAAQILLKEGFYRAAVNRCFYACYHMMLGALVSQGVDPARTKKRNLLRAFKTIFAFDSKLIEPEFIQIYEELQHLRRFAENATTDSPSPEEAHRALEAARRFVARIK